MKYNNQAAPLSHQLRVNQAVLEYLKLLHQHWTRNTDIFGDPENVALARLIVIGWMESKPFDVTDLANHTGMSRQQVARRCDRLGREGWVRADREGSRIVARPTNMLVEYTNKNVPKAMARTAIKWRKIATLMVEQPIELPAVARQVIGDVARQVIPIAGLKGLP
jgi:hypothetical protein